LLAAPHGRGYHGGPIDAYRLVGLLLEGVVYGEAPGPVVVHLFWLRFGFSAFWLWFWFPFPAFPAVRCLIINETAIEIQIRIRAANVGSEIRPRSG